MLKPTNLEENELYMGYITSGICSECGKDTFAADEICMDCKIALAEEDRLYFLGVKIKDCE